MEGVKVFSCIFLFIQKHCLKVLFVVVGAVVAAVVVMYNTSNIFKDQAVYFSSCYCLVTRDKVSNK